MASREGFDGFVVKLGAGGRPAWSRHLHGVGEQRAFSLAASAGGDVIVGGWFDGTIDVGGAIWTSEGRAAFVVAYDPSGAYRWGRVLPSDFHTLAADGEGSVFLLGDFTGVLETPAGPVASAGGRDVVVTKLDAGGVPRWSRTIGGAGDDYGRRVAVDPWGRAWVTGTLEVGTPEAFITGHVFVSRLAL
jgi:hypothetical protein